MIRVIAKNKKASLALGVSKLVLFVLLFSSGSWKAQCTPPTIAAFPAVELGQTLLIDVDDPMYNEVMEKAAISRATAEAYFNDNPCDPNYHVNPCPGEPVCCITKKHHIDPVTEAWVYITICWHNGSQSVSME